MAKQHNTSGKPSTNRGIPPHKGGYHAGKFKGVVPNKFWYEITIEYINMKAKVIKVPCSWKP